MNKRGILCKIKESKFLVCVANVIGFFFSCFLFIFFLTFFNIFFLFFIFWALPLILRGRAFRSNLRSFLASITAAIPNAWIVKEFSWIVKEFSRFEVSEVPEVLEVPEVPRQVDFFRFKQKSLVPRERTAFLQADAVN